jgi:hypothetical protein
MPQAVFILFGAAFTVVVSMALGTLFLRVLAVRLQQREERFFAFTAGAACLSLLVFLLAAAHLIYPGVLLALGAPILAAAVWRRAWAPMGEPLAPVAWQWRALFWALFVLFTYTSFFHAMAPETSPDGTQYHLGLVLRYLQAHGFRQVPSMYAYLSQGTEMLYLFAFAFGKHSAAALVHFSFLAALPFGMMLYARRFGFGVAGVVAALLVYLSPIVNWDGSTAYIDVAVACNVFALFYLLQIWDEDRQPGLLVLIGLLAGFSYGMKYTAFVAAPYAVGFVLWKSWRRHSHVLRSAAVVAACALVMIAPWMIRDWVWTGNPLAPFYNQWFPNPYIHISAEQGYRAQLAQWGGVTRWWQIPIEATVRGGRLQGFLGPVFLLAPLALLALRFRQGRQLLLAVAVFLAPYPANIGARFLIPAAVFLALAMGMALARWKAAAVLVVCAHAITSWPRVQPWYCSGDAVRLSRVPVRAALRIEPEDAYLSYWLHDYPMARMVERKVPPEAGVFATVTPPMAYCTREMWGTYECARCNSLSDMVGMAVEEWLRPTRRLTFRFAPRTLTAVRLLQTAARPEGEWSVNELQVLLGSAELARGPRWRVRASPNRWDAGLAFDGNPVTRWRTWQPCAGGESLEVDFGAPVQADTVALTAASGQDGIRLRLEGRDPAGNWSALAGEPDETGAPPPPQMRRLIALEMRRQGIEYMVIPDNSALASDLRARCTEWGVTALGSSRGLTLYRID